MTLLKVGAEGETTAIVASEQVSAFHSQPSFVLLPSSHARLLLVRRRSSAHMLGPTLLPLILLASQCQLVCALDGLSISRAACAWLGICVPLNVLLWHDSLSIHDGMA